MGGGDLVGAQCAKVVADRQAGVSHCLSHRPALAVGAIGFPKRGDGRYLWRDRLAPDAVYRFAFRVLSRECSKTIPASLSIFPPGNNEASVEPPDAIF